MNTIYESSIIATFRHLTHLLQASKAPHYTHTSARRLTPTLPAHSGTNPKPTPAPRRASTSRQPRPHCAREISPNTHNNAGFRQLPLGDHKLERKSSIQTRKTPDLLRRHGTKPDLNIESKKALTNSQIAAKIREQGRSLLFFSKVTFFRILPCLHCVVAYIWRVAAFECSPLLEVRS